MFKSKTIWFSFLLSVVGAIQVAIPNLESTLSARDYGIATMLVGVVVAGLRAVTTMPLKDK